jgi:NTE family protein
VDAAADVAFVLGGGGILGANEVGMLRALLEAGIRPDLVVGTSVGAFNGVLVAADPTIDAVDRLIEAWTRLDGTGVFAGSLFSRLSTLARTRTHAHPNQPLRALIDELVPVRRIEDLPVLFQCVAASIERAAEHWFDSGPIADAVLASSAVPGLLPPVEIDGEHFIDGGIVNSIPVGRAVQLGARTVYVLQVGRIERPLEVPTRPSEVGLVAFEIARRHRFATDMASLPPHVTAHVLPSGGVADLSRRGDLRQQLRYRDFGSIRDRIERAYEASRDYLAAAGITA